MRYDSVQGSWNRKKSSSNIYINWSHVYEDENQNSEDSKVIIWSEIYPSPVKIKSESVRTCRKVLSSDVNRIVLQLRQTF